MFASIQQLHRSKTLELHYFNSGSINNFHKIQYYKARFAVFIISTYVDKLSGEHFKTKVKPDHTTSIFAQMMISKTIFKSLRASLHHMKFNQLQIIKN